MKNVNIPSAVFSKFKIFFSFIVFISLGSHAHAETQYIDDTLYAPLRAGEGLEFRIVHKGVKSGTKVEVLETIKSSGYSKVKTPDGIIGYMPTRFLTAEPIARHRLAGMASELEKAQAKLADTSEKFSELQANFEKVSKSQEELLVENQTISSELESIKSISSNALYLDERNKQLHQTNEKLRSEVELLTTENQLLKDKSKTNFMMIGAALVVLGAFLALIIPMLKPTKKNDTWV